MLFLPYFIVFNLSSELLKYGYDNNFSIRNYLRAIFVITDIVTFWLNAMQYN